MQSVLLIYDLPYPQHVFYGKFPNFFPPYVSLSTCIEIAGTAGAFASSSAISRWGNNYSFFLTPSMSLEQP